MNKQLLNFVMAFVVGFAAISAGLFAYQKVSTPAVPSADLPMLWPNPKPLQDFLLMDQGRRQFDLASVQDKWTFWFFGYTHCPDVCPITLSVMNQLDQRLTDEPALRAQTQYVFVSVDPARDTPEALGRYVSFINPEFVAATGSDEELANLARQLGILYLLGEADESGNYLVDHTAAIVLTGPSAEFVALFSAPHSASDMDQKFRRIEAFISEHS